ncbi:hypothetical protein [Homoserinibacter sp. YIM 151385]|uniref:hypothetical protein n=1 Tax=Homoserinibacter sp. YIM 151385 TaxID=2985506 RepID=UPI0022EFEEAF|nr:hypothetical protein [Homoserinibacter sp. YIM 151385]WBU38166.1 hypothetical protein OF852_00865 [Homoserinibacter sp. YIM 151385]
MTVLPPAGPARTPNVHPRVAQGIDALLSVQRPVVLAHIRSIRARRPDASPEQIVRILERRYLAAVTSGGALVGASAAIPGVGVGASLALSGVETAGFLEASALFAQSVTEIHGIPLEDPERARTLVMTMILGNGGKDLIQQFASQAAGGPAMRNAYWGQLITSSLPSAALGQIADRVKRAFVRRFAASQSATVVGRAIPFGVGAAIGGTGNHLLGRKVIESSRSAFGPPPPVFPTTLDAVLRPPRDPRPPRRIPVLSNLRRGRKELPELTELPDREPGS